jgi:hypothetical protein
MKKRYSDEQIIGFLGEPEAGVPLKELTRKHGFSEGAFYLWRNKFGATRACASSGRRPTRETGRKPGKA